MKTEVCRVGFCFGGESRAEKSDLDDDANGKFQTIELPGGDFRGTKKTRHFHAGSFVRSRNSLGEGTQNRPVTPVTIFGAKLRQLSERSL